LPKSGLNGLKKHVLWAFCDKSQCKNEANTQTAANESTECILLMPGGISEICDAFGKKDVFGYNIWFVTYALNRAILYDPRDVGGCPAYGGQKKDASWKKNAGGTLPHPHRP